MTEGIKRVTPLGSMTSRFAFLRKRLLHDAAEVLYKEAGAENPELRKNFEIRQSDPVVLDGKATYSVSLWKKVGEKRITIMTDVSSSVVDVNPGDSEPVAGGEWWS